MISEIDQQLRNWFDWAEKTVSGGLGFLSSHELGLPGGGKPGPIHPEVIPPASLKPIHIAISEMPDDYWSVLVYRYGQPGKQVEQAKQLGVSRIAYRQKIHSAHCWLSGYIRSIDRK